MILIVRFDSLRPINYISVMQGRVFLGWTSTKLGLMCLAQGRNAVTPTRLEPAAPRSRAKHSTTESLRSLIMILSSLISQSQSPWSFPDIFAHITRRKIPWYIHIAHIYLFALASYLHIRLLSHVQFIYTCKTKFTNTCKCVYANDPSPSHDFRLPWRINVDSWH